MLSEIVDTFPEVATTLRRPRDPMGLWLLDVQQADLFIAIHWSPHRDMFGVTANPDPDNFDTRPDDSFASRKAATVRVLDLLGRR